MNADEVYGLLNGKINKLNNGTGGTGSSINDTTPSTTSTYSSTKIEEKISQLNTDLVDNIISSTPLENGGIYEFSTYPLNYKTASDNKTLALTADEFLNLYYNTWVGTHENGITVVKSIIGRDETDTYDVYEYDFIPANYNRVIMLSSGLHSYELTASFGLAYFMQHIMNGTHAPLFNYIRKNVRIKVAPILNMWGYNQSPKVYANVNGVNPNRNFDYNGAWASYPIYNNEWDYKGLSPFSEQETKNMCNWIYYNKNITDFFIDCHTGYNDTAYDNWVVTLSTSPLTPQITTTLTLLTNWIKTKYNVTTVNNNRQTDSPNSNKSRWCESVAGVPTLVLEQSPLRPKWCPSGVNNDPQSITNYATILYAYISTFLTIPSKTLTVKNKIFDSMCEHIPSYASMPYKALRNAGEAQNAVDPVDKEIGLYTINYYFSDVLDASKTINGVGYIGKAITIDKYSSSSQTIDVTKTSSNTLTTNGQVFSVYYRTTQTFNYTIEYYFDDVKDTSKSYTGNSLEGTTIIPTNYTDTTHTKDTTKGSSSFILSSNNQVFTVYYKTVEEGEDGEIIISDAFSSSFGSTTTGHVWTTDLGSFVSQSGVVRETSGNATGTTTVNTGVTNMDVSADMNWKVYTGLWIKYVSITDALLARINSTGLKLISYPGSSTTATLGEYVFTPTSGQIYNLRVVTKGTSVKVYLDNVLVIDTVDSTNRTGTRAGMRTSSDTTSTFDNFTVRTVL